MKHKLLIAIRSKAFWLLAVAALAGVGGMAYYFATRRNTPPEYNKMTVAQLVSEVNRRPTVRAFEILVPQMIEHGSPQDGLEMAKRAVEKFPRDAKMHNILGAAYGRV